MLKAGAAALVAAMTMWCGAAGAAVVITDPAGDANGGANAGLDQATGPVNDAARDLTKVVLSSDGGALNVAFTTSAPLDQGPIETFARLNLTTSTCPVSLIAYVGGTDSGKAPAYLPLVDAFDCGGFFSADGYSVSASGTTVTLRFPYEALRRAGAPITPATTLSKITADTLQGTAAYENSYCDGDPVVCAAFGADRHRAYLGPLIDKATTTAKVTARRRHR